MSRSVRGLLTSSVVLGVCVGLSLAVHNRFDGPVAIALLLLPILVGLVSGGVWVALVMLGAAFTCYLLWLEPATTLISFDGTHAWGVALFYLIAIAVLSPFLLRERQHRLTAEDRVRFIGSLLAVTEQLLVPQPLDDLLGVVCSTLVGSYGATSAAVLLREDAGLRLAASVGDPPDPAIVTALVNDAETALTEGWVRAELRVDGRELGQLLLEGVTVDGYRFDLLLVFANQVAAALQQALLRQRAAKAEHLEQVDLWRRTLLGAVNHDLRSPLASIRSSVTSLLQFREVLDEDDQLELLREIDAQASRLNRLVTNLLDMVKIESGALVLRAEPTAVLKLVDDARAGIGLDLASRTLAFDLDDEAHFVDCDDVLITQVLVNLLLNASKHSPPGSTITIVTRREGPRVRLSVVDEGEGVPMEQRTRLFRAMERQANSARTGLGLTISAAFVEAHGSNIQIGDAPNGGASFSFTLPIVTAKEIMRRSSTAASEIGRTSATASGLGTAN